MGELLLKKENGVGLTVLGEPTPFQGMAFCLDRAERVSQEQIMASWKPDWRYFDGHVFDGVPVLPGHWQKDCIKQVAGLFFNDYEATFYMPWNYDIHFKRAITLGQEMSITVSSRKDNSAIFDTEILVDEKKMTFGIISLSEIFFPYSSCEDTLINEELQSEIKRSEISGMLPQEKYALCIDRALRCSNGNIIGLWKPEEFYFEGQDLPFPILSENWIEEFAALSGCILAMKNIPETQGKIPFLRDITMNHPDEVFKGEEVKVVAFNSRFLRRTVSFDIQASTQRGICSYGTIVGMPR